MGIVHIFERGGEDYRDFKKAVKKAKEAIEVICELTEDMEEQYGERFSSRDDDMMEERRSKRPYYRMR